MIALANWLPAIAPSALPTVAQGVQLLAALAVPYGMYLVLEKPATIRWKDILRAAGGIFLPSLLIVAMQEGISIAATSMFIGVMLGHTVTMMDTD